MLRSHSRASIKEGTPIPGRDNELRSTQRSACLVRQATPEELARADEIGERRKKLDQAAERLKKAYQV